MIYKTREDDDIVLDFTDKEGKTLGVLTVDRDDVDTILQHIGGTVIPANHGQNIVCICCADPEEPGSCPKEADLYVESSPLIGWTLTEFAKFPITATTLDDGMMFLQSPGLSELIPLDGSGPIELAGAKERALDREIRAWKFRQSRAAKPSDPATDVGSV